MNFTDYHHRKRYAGWRDPPSACQCCGESLVVLTGNEAAYGRPVGDWPWIYLCMLCGAFVGCHPYSVFPLGVMADKETRQMRRALHAMIDRTWQSGFKTRSETYQLMRRLTGTPGEFHIGELDKAGCLRANEAFRAWETAADFDDPPW